MANSGVGVRHAIEREKLRLREDPYGVLDREQRGLDAPVETPPERAMDTVIVKVRNRSHTANLSWALPHRFVGRLCDLPQETELISEDTLDFEHDTVCLDMTPVCWHTSIRLYTLDILTVELMDRDDTIADISDDPI